MSQERRKNPIIQAKVCNDCGVLKAITDFYKRSENGNPRSMCKKCDVKRCTKYHNEAFSKSADFRNKRRIYFLNWRHKYPDKARKNSSKGMAKWGEKARAQLNDTWVKGILQSRIGIERKFITQEMIEVERQRQLIKRHLKEMKA